MTDRLMHQSITAALKWFMAVLLYILICSGCQDNSPAQSIEVVPIESPLPTNTALVGEGAVSSIVLLLENPPTIDGTISSGEWDQATVEAFADGSQLFLMQAADFLYVGIRANEPGTIAGNVFIQRADEITILHSSAALGTAVYQKGEGDWQQIRDFSWCCRNTGNSDAAQAERTGFLQNEGWLAANGLMGTPNELEYQIKISNQDFRMAVVYIRATYPYEKVPWPAGLEDDCIAPSSGGLPLEMQFAPQQWARLELAQ